MKTVFILLTSLFFMVQSGFAQSVDTTITDAEKIYGLSKFWQEVNYNFAYFDQVPDLDWNATYKAYIPKVLTTKSVEEYYKVLQEFSALLNDGHTNVYPPAYILNQFDSPKVDLQEIQHKAVVIDVGQHLRDELPIGSQITEVDGIPTETYLRTKLFPYISSSTEYIRWDQGINQLLSGKRGSKVTISFSTPDGQSGTLTLTRDGGERREPWVHARNKRRRLLEYRPLYDDIAYVALNSFGDMNIVAEFEKHLPELYEAQGLILDLRKNGGGNSDVSNEIIKYLTDQPFVESKWKTREHRAAFKAWGQFAYQLSADQLKQLSAESLELLEEGKPYYKGTAWYEGEHKIIQPGEGRKITAPIVVLIGHNTASAAEDFLIAMDSIKRGTFVGQKTFGSTGQPLMFDLPGGGSARVVTKRDTYPDGREFVGYGIKPHITVELTIDDFIANRDPVLEKAIKAKWPEAKPLNIPLTPVASWPMDENEGTALDDETTNDNDGTIHSAVRTQGKLGSALEFDGVDDYVGVPDSPSLDIEKAITLEAWVYPKYETWPDYYTYAISKNKAYVLAFKEGKLYMALYHGSIWDVYTSQTTLPLDKWSHIAGTFDGVTVRLYLNGTQIHSEEAFLGLNINKSDYDLRIGSFTNPERGVERFFKGIIDEVRIYEGALMAEQIAREYEKTKR